MSFTFEKLLTHMSEKNLGFWTNRQEQAVCVNLPGIVGNYQLILQVSADEDYLYVFGKTHLKITPGCRAAVAETIERAISGLTDGSLELNSETDELRFQASEHVPGDEPDGDVIDRLIAESRAAMDVYLQAILSVIYGNELPEDALRHALTGQGL